MCATQAETQRLQSASWLDHEHGLAILKEDWKFTNRMPPLRIDPGNVAPKRIERTPLSTYAQRSGYYIDQGKVTFYLCPSRFPNVELDEKKLYVAGEFNNWSEAIGHDAWQLKRHDPNKNCYTLEVLLARVCPRGKPTPKFKFVTGDNIWADVPLDAPNRQVDANGNTNFILDRKRSGRHLFTFIPKKRHPILGHEQLTWKGTKVTETIPITYGHLLTDLKTDEPLGTYIEDGKTVFRIFAPRAKSVKVVYSGNLSDTKGQTAELLRVDDSVWEKVIPKELEGWVYHYSIDGDNLDNFSMFDPDFHVLDPYALAAVSGKGPGIIVNRDKLPKTSNAFQPPAWHDLIILEAHVRDLAAHAPVRMDPQERRGFKGVTKWLQSDDCYLTELGINAVELQPIQENDSPKPEAYHWGYMTSNFFAPASSYATDPLRATQIEEFKEMVDAFHKRDLAVILDVVYNHVGDPAHLMFIDKEYYFETTAQGDLMNYSGCGNDLQANAPMAQRLIIDSLTHLVETYDVDGFRFDLAELLGVHVLKKIEKALKKVKPSIILIAEPWSFRGHIAQALRHTGWASWNDGYRDFATQYVRGHGTRDTFRYFLSGSPHYFAMFPAQTVNYTASHDDRCWLDRITENRDHNGSWPTLNDRRRTHLMGAFLLASLGVPMLASGQDFLHSKQGVNNTYQRGDLNALEYNRMRQFPNTHDYFRSWINFRLSKRGRLFRLNSRQSDGYLRFYEYGDTSAIGCLYNADHSHGDEQILFAINPHHYAFEMPIEDPLPGDFLQIADHERFNANGLPKPNFFWGNGRLRIPPMSCGLWISR